MDAQTTPARSPRRARVVAAVIATLLVGVLSGCGVRLETPPPKEPVPDAFEQVRRTAVADALGIAELATTALQADGLPEPVATELTRVVTDAYAHADALGGVYDSGLDADDIEVAPDTAPVTAVPADVVAVLSDAAGRNRTGAATTSSGDLARLLSSIGAAQTVAATRLATFAQVAGPEPVRPVMPQPDLVAASPSPAPSPDDVETTSPGEESAVLPAGLTASDFSSLVVAEDSARYALELRAARTADEARARLLERSRVHGERAQAWAELGGVAGTAQDPRRVAYEVPRDQDDATLVQAIQTGLATDYASLVGTTAPSTRGLLVDLLIDAALTLDTWGAPPPAFPGLPEQVPPQEG